MSGALLLGQDATAQAISRFDQKEVSALNGKLCR
jgi:hypothetical protein